MKYCLYPKVLKYMLIQSMPGLPIEAHEHAINPGKEARKMVVFKQELGHFLLFLMNILMRNIYDDLDNFKYCSTMEIITKNIFEFC